MVNGFQQAVLREEVVDQIVKGFEKELGRRVANVDDGLARMRAHKSTLQAEISNLTDVMPQSGYQSPALIQRLAVREKELQAITDELLEPRGSLRIQIRDLRTFAIDELADIKKLLSAPENITHGRTKLVQRWDIHAGACKGERTAHLHGVPQG